MDDSSDVGAGVTVSGWASLGPRAPPPLQPELPALAILQQANLFASAPKPDVPLLVPLVNGGVTNVHFDESLGEPQEALIERYLALMGLARQPQTQPQPQMQPQPQTQPAAAAASIATAAAASQDLATTGAAISASAAGEDGGGGSAAASDSPVALQALGLDRDTLSRRSVPEPLIGALHRGLAASAAAFFRTCLAEQRRLLVLTHGSGPQVPLADRLLAFITGTEGQLAAGSAPPNLAELRKAKDTQAVLDAVSAQRPTAPVLFHHELERVRQQQQPPPPISQQDSESKADSKGPDLEALMDLDRITALATAGNVPGLRALMRGLVEAMQYTRTSLQERLAAEGERAQRERARATEARQLVDKLREQLEARNSMLAERGAELEAACRRATAAEEALVTERAVVAGLRGQLRQLTADYEEQHRQLRETLAAQATAPVAATQPASLELHVLSPHPAAPDAAGPAPPPDPSDPHGALRLAAQLAATRSELALAELSCAQERALGRQLRVMLESVRATVDMHAGRAAEAAAEVERLNRLVAASSDLASTASGGMAILEQQLVQEKAAHRRTTERLQSVGWKYEQARTAVVDIRSRAAHSLRRLQTALADVNLRAITAERQLADVSIDLRSTQDKLEATANSFEALKDRSARMEVDMESMRREAVAAKMDLTQVLEQLRDTQTELRTAEARVQQMQQKVMADADVVMAGKAASERLIVLEKEHEELCISHTNLRRAHDQLLEDHSDLTEQMAAARARIADLEVKETQLAELTVKHDELQALRARLEQQVAALQKSNGALSSELAGLRRHADVLAEQVQEQRRLAELAKIDLESEKDQHRHTKEELSITSAKRDQLDSRCTELSEKLDALETRVRCVDEEVARCRRTAELAGYQRAEAFAVRDAMAKARIMLSCDLKEFLTLVEGQVREMDTRLGELQTCMTAVQSRLLDIGRGTLEGTDMELPEVSYEEAQKMGDALFKVVTHGSQMLETQSEVRKALVARIEQLEDGLKERLEVATDYWRQVLLVSRGSPRSMVQMVERMTGQACRELDLDPVNPLARMVPVGVLEEAGLQLNAQYERVGALRSNVDTSKSDQEAAQKLLERERQVSAARAAEFQSLVDTLAREVNRLKARVSSLEANNAMQQKATAEMQRLLSDAEWKVAKAQEREALTGIKFMVPHGRETKAVQTVFNDLFMLTSGSAPPLPPGASAPSPHPYARSQMSIRSAAAVTTAAGSTLDGGDDGEVWGVGVAEDGAGGGDGMAAANWATAAMMAAAAGGLYEAPSSPSSLPPLSGPASPMPSGGNPWSGAPTRAVSTGQSYSAVLRPASSASIAAAPSSRPQSNLSRTTSALTPSLLNGRSTSPDAAPGPLAAAAAAVADAGPADAAADGSLGRTPSSTNTAVAGPGSRFTAHPLSHQLPQPQRRRHPDEVSSRRSGANVAMSAVPSISLLPSMISSVVADGSATAGGGGSGTDRGYTSDGTVLATGATSDGGHSDGDEFPSYASPSTSPPGPLRTPSTSATAAAAAFFAATAAGGGGGTAALQRVAAGGSLYGNGPTSALAAAAAGGGASGGGGGSSSAQPPRPATASQHGAGGGSPHIANSFNPQNHHAHAYTHTHALRLSAPAMLQPSRPGSPILGAPPTPSGIPHGWQHSPWDWLPDAAPLARGAVPYSRQALLEIIADIHYTKGLHDQVAAAAAFPATSMQQYIGAYFEARHGPRGCSPPMAELALAQLLVSLEAHSALYDVMLFARAAGLQPWSGKSLRRNGSSSHHRPATATATATAATQPLSMAPSAAFPRPRTSHAALYGGLAPYASAATGAGGGRMLSSPRQSAAAGRNSGVGRTMSARTSAVGMGPIGSPLNGLLPSAREGIDLGSPAPLPSAPCGETVLRLRTGHSPAVFTPAATGSGGPSGCHSPLARRPSMPLALPHPPRPQLRFRPELLVSEPLSGLLGRLGEVSGMEALCQFVSSGRVLGRLRAADLGQPLREEQHPELHFTVQRVCQALSLPETPELLVRESLPYGADVMLLQIPYVATNSLSLLASPDVDRQPVAAASTAPVAAASAAAGGWRRRAVLIFSPALVAAVPVAAAAAAPVAADLSPAWGVPGGVFRGVDYEEVQALLGAALAPIAMPGGQGWRLDVQAAGSGAAAGGAAGIGVGPVAAGPAGHSPSPSPPPAPTLLSAAEVITAVNVAALKPRAVPAALPTQLQFKWERLLAHLRLVAAAATLSADRGALLVTQAVAPAMRAVFRSAVGMGLQPPEPQSPGGWGPHLGSGEELLLQAQTMPVSDEEMLGMAAMPLHDAAASGGEVRRSYALARVALLAHWAEAAEYRQTLRSSVMQA